ncbi:hypothetical protein LCGC14_1675500 [marine sediment metagenome]|uniref:Uncharacterized protein n=1 Tax=marine sediment metagenome TaxID=412755 RepID=A0A0F9HQ59_9ZZZZ
MYPRAQPKTGKEQLTHDIRADKAIELRLAGWTLGEIARELGYSGTPAVSRAVSRRRKRILSPLIAEERKMQCDRLDAMLKGLWEQAITGDVKAVQSVLGIMARRASVMGLDKGREDSIPREEVERTISMMGVVLQQFIPEEKRDEFRAALRRSIRGLDVAKMVDVPVVIEAEPGDVQELAESDDPNP